MWAVDATYGTNTYGLKLITIVAMDPKTNQVYPISFCVFSRENKLAFVEVDSTISHKTV